MQTIRDPHLKLQDAELATFASRDLKRTDLKFSKSWTPNARLAYKTRVSKLKYEVHHARVWRTWDLKVNKLAFHQLTRKARLQSMDAWISRKRFQVEIKRQSLFMADDDRASRKPSLIMAKTISYLKKNSLEGGHHSSRYGHESTRGDVFLFWNHLVVIIFEEDFKKVLKFWVFLRTLKVFQDACLEKKTV